jgi:hypothetical protein
VDDFGGTVMKFSFCIDGLDYEPQSDYNVFTFMLVKAEETVETYNVACKRLTAKVLVKT